MTHSPDSFCLTSSIAGEVVNTVASQSEAEARIASEMGNPRETERDDLLLPIFVVRGKSVAVVS
jgi:hypothetical protein